MKDNKEENIAGRKEDSKPGGRDDFYSRELVVYDPNLKDNSKRHYRIGNQEVKNSLQLAILIRDKNELNNIYLNLSLQPNLSKYAYKIVHPTSICI